MTQTHDMIVRRQFGEQAAAYVESSVHAGGEDLDWIEQVAARARPAHALDLGTGGGHVAYRLARQAGRVTASDLAGEMVAAVLATAEGKGLANVAGEIAPAEALPFADAAFDLLACRFSAHHWRDFEAGLREARRVLASGAPALFVDVVAPERPSLDMHLQAVELLRDPSHVRDYRVSEWIAALGRAGFEIRDLRSLRLRMDFPSWTARMRTSELHVAAIRSLQSLASADVAGHFALEADGSFTIDTVAIEAI
ncbi:class I SAM-dependent methyltransferase [Flavisphingomonas formosensis]|uniref:class I SAM-dependent methyltransferase n=1 Tax=Flavisphingomonas formosensis TaxID=861534 RepID=UPI0012F788D5|nr:class I SAM-dependent methyltransferase [Sphingomonas formosensis]